MNLNALKPIGPHVEGFIRFAHEGEGDDFRQLDHFQVLSRVHNEPSDEAAAPCLAEHPIAANLRSAEAKLKAIPVKLVFDKPGNNLSARYQAYDVVMGRLCCVGDGQTASRASFASGTTTSETCVGPGACSHANTVGVRCALHVRLKVQIEGQTDPFAVFELQSGGINTYRTLSAKLDMMHAAFGQLRHVPLTLAMYEKSSPLSSFEPFYVADLRLRDDVSPAEALKAAKEAAEAEQQAGLLIDKMEAAVESMAATSPFAIDDVESVLMTFTPGIVDRGREPRERTRTAAEVPSSIQAIVAQATRRESVAPAGEGASRPLCDPSAGHIATDAKIGPQERPPTAI
jgi:hypothetical protein